MSAYIHTIQYNRADLKYLESFAVIVNSRPGNAKVSLSTVISELHAKFTMAKSVLDIIDNG